mmetsp:Transcript_42433/g.99624  ORF Transcript_42433/g.99624 Transcript_42433/m.99624 type:complete len:534 (+) Transcript_42433:228-1829(+)
MRNGKRTRSSSSMCATLSSVLVTAFLFALSPSSTTAYDPFQQDSNQPFNINSTNRFHPAQSLSFAQVLFDGFDLKYADTADLDGYIGQDIVGLGRYYARTKFGCITKCDSADFNGVDGILGLGMPDAALASIPEPLFFAITDNTGDPVSQRILKDRKFTMLVTKDAGELQLGGYDHRSIKPGHKMHFMKTTSTAEYSVPITSIKFGGQELLNFATVINPRVPGRMSWIPGILDSGTSCLVLPDSLLQGILKEKPFTKFASLAKNPLYDKTRRLPITIGIGGHTFTIPFEEWWLESDQRPCVQTSPPAFMGVLLGDVLFRSLVVQFDLTHPTIPVIGLAQRNRHYKPVRPGSSWERHKPSHSFNFGLPEGYDDEEEAASSSVDKVPLDTGLQTQIFINVTMGTPRQQLKVILDTGSSVFAVFCNSPPKKGEPRFAHIYLPHFIPSFMGHHGPHDDDKPHPTQKHRGRSHLWATSEEAYEAPAWYQLVPVEVPEWYLTAGAGGGVVLVLAGAVAVAWRGPRLSADQRRVGVRVGT